MQRIGEWAGTVARAAAVAAVAALGAAGVARAQPVAALLDVGPGATVTRSGVATKASLLHRLEAGDELALPARTRAVLLFLKSGDEYALEGPAVARVEGAAPSALSGPPAVRRTLPPNRETRVRPERLAQGGLVLRTAPPPPPPPTVTPEAIAERRPPADAPIAERVAYGLWLEEVNAVAEAKAQWRALAAERPDEPAIAARAR